MGPSNPSGRHVVLLEIDRAELVPVVSRLLEIAGVPHRAGLMAADPPVMVITVPEERLEDARAAIAEGVERVAPRPRAAPAPDPDGDDENDAFAGEPVAANPFPWGAVRAAGAVVLLHLAIVFWTGGPLPGGHAALDAGLLVAGRTLAEPWRLLTSLFLHADPTHALSNGVSMLVFAVPLIVELGYRRTILIYLAAGIGGGLTALSFAREGTAILGSSGAVAGLFGAWVSWRLARAHAAVLPWRARVRAIGIGMLVLPSFLTPMTPSGHPVSVGSHVGGLLTGMAIGAILHRSLTREPDWGHS